MMEGYVFLHRKFINTSFFKNKNDCCLAIYFLLKANYADGKCLIDGKDIIIKRGQLIIGYKVAVEATGMSRQEYRTSLCHLVTCDFLTIQSTTHYSIITIRKYEDYQFSLDMLPTTASTTDQPPLNHRLTTYNKNKKNKNKESCALFEEFYALYPRHKGREPALERWVKIGITKEFWESTIKPALLKQKDMSQWQDIDFVPYPATWLHNKGWEDEIQADSSSLSEEEKRAGRIFHENARIEREKKQGVGK